jgi:hypothetical protein
MPAANPTIDPSSPCDGGECSAPVAVIRGPAVASNCGVVELSGDESLPGGAFGPSYEWRLVQMNAVDVPPLGSTGAVALAAHLSQLSPTTSRAVFELPRDGRKNGTLTFALTVTSFLGLRSEQVSWTLAHTSAPVPSVSISGPSERVVQAGSALTLQGSAVASPCWPEERVHAEDVRFEWTLAGIFVDGTGEPLALSEHPSSTADDSATPAASSAHLVQLLLGGAVVSPRLAFGPGSFVAGLNYELALSVRMAAHDSASTAQGGARVQVRVVPEQVSAHIGGGSLRRVSVTRSVSFLSKQQLPFSHTLGRWSGSPTRMRARRDCSSRRSGRVPCPRMPRQSPLMQAFSPLACGVSRSQFLLLARS